MSEEKPDTAVNALFLIIFAGLIFRTWIYEGFIQDTIHMVAIILPSSLSILSLGTVLLLQVRAPNGKENLRNILWRAGVLLLLAGYIGALVLREFVTKET